MKKTTIKDIANQLSVSPSTISRALSDHPDISPILKEKIKQKALELRYRPSTAALNLKRGTNRIIALIIPEITSFFYPSVIHGMEATLHQQGYTLLVLLSNDNLTREKENIDIAYDQNVAGVIIAVSKETQELSHLELLDGNNTPIVLIDKVIETSPYTNVTIDDYRVSYDMVQHLYKTGCRKIAGLFGKTSLNITHQRYKGFSQAIKDVGLFQSDSLVGFVNNSHEAYEQTVQLVQKNNPDGLYLMTDEIMLGTMPALAYLNKRPPADIAVLAISDGELPGFMIPTVSHMKHDGYQLGRLSAQNLIQQINAKQNNQPTHQGERILMNTNIVLLESTR